MAFIGAIETDGNVLTVGDQIDDVDEVRLNQLDVVHKVRLALVSCF